jgi:arginyl-tRNA synthetase
MRNYRQRWRELVRDALSSMQREAGRAEAVPAEALVPETPPSPELGDIAFPMFPFAKILRQGPPLIAQEVVRRLAASAGLRTGGGGGPSGGGTASAAGPYVNVKLDRPSVTAEVLEAVSREGDGWGRTDGLDGMRYFVEFSCPNTNKPLHIGHLRNDAIGESLSRILSAAGATVLKANLINDRGAHICKSMLAYQRFGGGATPESAGVKGDHFVGDWYVRYHTLSQEDPSADDEVRALLRRWEGGDPATRELWRRMNGWVMEGIGETYRRTGISFDRTSYESDLYTIGRDVVLDGLARGLFERDPDGSVWVDLAAEGLDREVLLRSDGTSLYLTQDIGLAFHRATDWPFDRLVYVVASEQRRHFQVLFKVLARLGFERPERLHHLAYGMVNLPEGKMKSREGTVVDADDLLDELERMAAEEIRAKERDEEVGDLSATSRDIALGALHYWLLATSPQKDMSFDPKESLSFNGNTGPYLQYTGARIQSMLRKYEERRERYAAGRVRPELLSLPVEWEILKSVALFPETVAVAARDLAPSSVAVHLFELSKSFSRWYQEHPVLRNEDPDLVLSRIGLVRAVAQVLANGLRLLAIPFLEAM